MTWTWDQSAGTITGPRGQRFDGYAGHDWGKNNPAADAAPGIGPLPRGRWHMTSVGNSQNTGPFTIRLEPGEGTDCHGRSQFRIHGDSVARPGTASHGCIILSRSAREAIWASGDHDLLVIA